MTTANTQTELLDRARNVIRELREKLAAAEQRNVWEPIAIVGMAGRFPGAGDDLNGFWQMIAEGRDAVTEVPRDRWDSDLYYSAKAPVAGKTNLRRAAFLDEVARFDAGFFDVTPIEAVRMDPQQRIFMETAWHALEDAGLTRSELRGSLTGVFAGVHGHSADYGAMQFADATTLDGYAATGTAHDVIAGRLAYWLDLRGPAMVVDTACSSSLVAVHLACRSLRVGDCDCAIVGGTNLILSPQTSVAMSQLQMLADDGRSKTFDSRADGFGRGEGCCVVVLKRLNDALQNGDRVLALIRATAINQDGRTNGLTAPSGLAQQRLLERALAEARVSAAEIGYFEAHGTGTALGDPIEVEAIAAVMGGTARSRPCVLGAVKANIGHLEGAAGLAGLLKAVLVMQHGWFPPVAHLETLNPHLALEGSGLEIPVRGKQWPEDVHKFCGVSSFGWSGTNAHVVLEEAPKQQEPATAKLPVVIALSAMTTEALRQLAEAFAVQMEKADERELAAMGYTSTARRTHYRYRLAVFGSEGPKMAALLRKRAAEFSADGGVALANASGTFHAQQLDQVNPDELIAAYESGTEIDWQERYPHSGEGIALPQYPFGGRRYWLAESKTAAPSRETRTAEAQPTPTCMDPASAGEAGAETELVRGLRGLSPRDRYERLLSFLINETRAIIGLAAEEAIDEERGLIEMGMDSLMTVMLQNGLQSALGIELSSTLVLDYPSLTALAHYLDKKVFGKAEEAAPSGPAAVNALDQSDAEAESIASMSSAEMDAALAEELAAVRRLGVQ